MGKKNNTYSKNFEQNNFLEVCKHCEKTYCLPEFIIHLKTCNNLKKLPYNSEKIRQLILLYLLEIEQELPEFNYQDNDLFNSSLKQTIIDFYRILYFKKTGLATYDHQEIFNIQIYYYEEVLILNLKLSEINVRVLPFFKNTLKDIYNLDLRNLERKHCDEYINEKYIEEADFIIHDSNIYNSTTLLESNRWEDGPVIFHNFSDDMFLFN